jgi:hypothetical protein
VADQIILLDAVAETGHEGSDITAPVGDRHDAHIAPLVTGRFLLQRVGGARVVGGQQQVAR